MPNIIYFVTDFNRKKILIFAENRPLLHQKLIELIENKEIQNDGGYRVFKANQKDFKSIIMKIKDENVPFYKVAVPKKQ